MNSSKWANEREEARLIVSKHAKKRTSERGIHFEQFRDVRREATRTKLHEHLVEQHNRLTPILTNKPVLARVGDVVYKADNHEISIRLGVNGTTFVVGIRKSGEGHTPLIVATAWN
jgi:hypothetical protein